MNNTRTLKTEAKWDSAIIRFLIYTCAFSLRCQMPSVKKACNTDSPAKTRLMFKRLGITMLRVLIQEMVSQHLNPIFKTQTSISSSIGADFCMKVLYPIQQHCFSHNGGLMRGPDSTDKRISHYRVPPSDLLGLARTSNTNLFCKQPIQFVPAKERHRSPSLQ